MKFLYIIIGSISLALGIMGIFLPVLPTTPFLLLTAALYFRSSPRLYHWLLNHRYLGSYIRHFMEERAIPLRVKIISVSLLWVTAAHCIGFVFTHWWSRLLMSILSVGVTCYILSFKTRKKE